MTTTRTACLLACRALLVCLALQLTNHAGTRPVEAPQRMAAADADNAGHARGPGA